MIWLGGASSGHAQPSDAERDAEVFGAPVAEPESEPADGAPAGSPPSDADRDAAIFGEPTTDSAAESTSESPGRDAQVFGAGSSTPDDRDAAMLGDPQGDTRFAQDVAPSDPLTVGGLLYLRSQQFLLQGQPLRDWRLTVPTLAQLYFDARPNDRVRGFMQFRMQYDPTLPSGASNQLEQPGPLAPGASSNGVQSLGAAFQSRTRDPRLQLDQLWINFDIDYAVFVTVGKQHDRWGTARFWMPTDYLHLQNRNPIDVFDSRAGTNMLKLHMPIESLAWNFYAYAVLETAGEATPDLSHIAGALRAEFVVDTLELGLGGFARRDESPRGALDVSFALWDFDVYGELALRDAGEVSRVGFAPEAPLPPASMPPSWQTPSETARLRLAQVADARYPVSRGDGLAAQAVTGFTYAVRYDDDDVLTLGAEYFYNELGYGTPDNYLGLLLPHGDPLSNPATFFYLGRHYLAAFVTLPAPFSLDLHTFTFSTLGNLSDRSFLSRFDYAYTLLTHLRFEAFVAVHYGDRQGEFRFGLDNVPFDGVAFSQAPALLDTGVALRLEY